MIHFNAPVANILCSSVHRRTGHLHFGQIAKWLRDWWYPSVCRPHKVTWILRQPSHLCFCPPPFAKAGDIKTHSSVRPSVHLSVCHKNLNLAHIFWNINDRALIFGMHDLCDKSFLLVPCGDLDLWPTTRSNLLPDWGPQFFEFACIICFAIWPYCL